MQSGNFLTTYRGIDLVDSATDNWSGVSPGAASDEAFVGLLTGCTPSSTVGIVTIHYVFDIIPLANQTQLAVMDFPLPGPFTTDFLGVM